MVKTVIWKSVPKLYADISEIDTMAVYLIKEGSLTQKQDETEDNRGSFRKGQMLCFRILLLVY